MTRLSDDIGSTLRSVSRSPRHVILTAGCLALGLGANAVMFGVVDALFLRAPSGVANANAIVRLNFDRTVRGPGHVLIDKTSYPLAMDLRDGSSSIESAATYYVTTVSEGYGSSAAKLRAVLGSGDYFSLLGVKPQRGRLFRAADARPESPGVAVIGDGLWRRRFARDENTIGRKVRIADRLYTIIGVAPPGFRGADLEAVDIWLPMEIAANDLIMPNYIKMRGVYTVDAIAKLKPGVGRRSAEADVTRAFKNIMRSSAGFDTTDHIILSPIQRERGPKEVQPAKVTAWLGSVSCAVLLIACVNCASLVFLRSLRRERELAIRAALGASCRRLLSMLVVENAIIAILGALTAVAVAAIGTRALRALLLSEDVPPDFVSWPRLVFFALGVGLVASIFFALPSLIGVLKQDLRASLTSGAQWIGQRRRVRTLFLVVQVGSTTLLLAGAGLFVVSLRNARRFDLGFEPRNAILVNVDFAGFVARASTATVPDILFERLANTVRGIPGVTSAGVGTLVPFQPVAVTSFTIPGQDTPGMPRRSAVFTAASPEYLPALGLRLIDGRWFQSADNIGGRAAVVINETMARQFWPGASAVGKCVVRPAIDSTCTEIVGVVADTRTKDLREPAKPQLYAADLGKISVAHMARTLVVRVTNTAALLPTTRRAIEASEPNLPYVQIQPLQALVDPVFRSWDLGATMFSMFGALALLLSVIGIYGSLSSAIDERKQEFAIRIALGASPAAIWALTARRMGILIAAGVGTGLLGLRWTAPALQSLLFGIQSLDIRVLTVTLVTVVISAASACYPALARAGRVDPINALRST